MHGLHDLLVLVPTWVWCSVITVSLVGGLIAGEHFAEWQHEDAGLHHFLLGIIAVLLTLAILPVVLVLGLAVPPLFYLVSPRFRRLVLAYWYNWRERLRLRWMEEDLAIAQIDQETLQLRADQGALYERTYPLPGKSPGVIDNGASESYPTATSS